MLWLYTNKSVDLFPKKLSNLIEKFKNDRYYSREEFVNYLSKMNPKKYTVNKYRLYIEIYDETIDNKKLSYETSLTN